MSQIYKSLVSGPVPPSVATSYVTDENSPAVPAANILNVIGGQTSEDADDGIQTDGSSGSNTLTIQLTNRIQGGVQTNDATPTTASTFTMADIGTYIFEMKGSAYNETDGLGAGYSLFGTARFDGTNSFLVGTPDKIVNEEVGMALCDFNMIVAGAGSGLVSFQVTGLAGKVIDWCSVGLYCVAMG